MIKERLRHLMMRMPQSFFVNFLYYSKNIYKLLANKYESDYNVKTDVTYIRYMG